MRLAICDDQASCLSEITAVATEYTRAHPTLGLSTDTFSHPEDLLAAAERIGGYDLYVLDVVMPNMNGIELGLALREAGYEGKIIYLTSSEEYSLDAFRVKAFDYLVKPVQRDAFFRTMDEAIAQIGAKRDRFFVVKSRERSTRLYFDSILYAELTRRAVCYHLQGGRTVESTSLRTTFPEAVAELLADKRFYLCGAGMVVNLDHVTEIESDAVVFGEAGRALLGEKNCRKLRQVWSTYLFDGEV